VYPERGTIELRVTDLDPSVGIGDHELARRDARDALRRDGLLDAQAALRLSAPPLRVGIVATRGSRLGRPAGRPGASAWAFRLRVVRSPAEGANAPERVPASLRLAALGADVVVLARGGGSAVRLPYDTEVVARAIATCAVPVIAAVGHASDRSLADEVAWRSTPTPSAAAALLESLVADADARVVEVGRQIADLARRRLDETRRDLDHLEDDIARGAVVSAEPLPHPSRPSPAPAETVWRRLASSPPPPLRQRS
jgi:exodeoxyribonuclease VII large subunit